MENLPKAFTDAFTITPGGTHADGKTHNKLVILGSGVYLEFIAFVRDDTKLKEGHWWGKKSAGTIIDWALTSSDVSDVKHLTESGIYDEPRSGGRERGDGKEVKWFVTFPDASIERGSVPFFCHDDTPRELRVPIEGIKHPSGATGVAKVVVVAATDKVADIAKTYTTILGKSEGSTWKLQEPASLKSATSQASPVIELREATSEEELRLVEENGGVAGVKEISLYSGAENAKDVEVVLEGEMIRIKFTSS